MKNGKHLIILTNLIIKGGGVGGVIGLCLMTSGGGGGGGVNILSLMTMGACFGGAGGSR